MRQQIKSFFLTIIGIGAALTLFSFVVGCPFRRMTGIACPFCGMTRAALSVLRLDFAGAVQYHPLIFLLPPLGVILLFHVKQGKRLPQWIFYSVYILLGMLFLAVWLWRLCKGWI
uniref:DUF2752 domain-containing protein n=1 Tax=uncultured Bacillota bacterium TaxID=344338 RepID=A0A650EN48_9FIRM|nr:hypothetical protein Firmicute1046_2560 [uncultured Firmicutes bacterium]